MPRPVPAYQRSRPTRPREPTRPAAVVGRRRSVAPGAVSGGRAANCRAPPSAAVVRPLLLREPTKGWALLAGGGGDNQHFALFSTSFSCHALATPCFAARSAQRAVVERGFSSAPQLRSRRKRGGSSSAATATVPRRAVRDKALRACFPAVVFTRVGPVSAVRCLDSLTRGASSRLKLWRSTRQPPAAGHGCGGALCFSQRFVETHEFCRRSKSSWRSHKHVAMQSHLENSNGVLLAAWEEHTCGRAAPCPCAPLVCAQRHPARGCAARRPHWWVHSLLSPETRLCRSCRNAVSGDICPIGVLCRRSAGVVGGLARRPVILQICGARGK